MDFGTWRQPGDFDEDEVAVFEDKMDIDDNYRVDVFIDTGLAPSLDKIELVEDMMDFELDINGAHHDLDLNDVDIAFQPTAINQRALPLRGQRPSWRADPYPPPSVRVALVQRRHRHSPVAAHAARPAVPRTPQRSNPFLAPPSSSSSSVSVSPADDLGDLQSNPFLSPSFDRRSSSVSVSQDEDQRSNPFLSPSFDRRSSVSQDEDQPISAGPSFLSPAVSPRPLHPRNPFAFSWAPISRFFRNPPTSLFVRQGQR